MVDNIEQFKRYEVLRWSGILKSIKKSSNVLQPLFEAFTNSLEAITLRLQTGASFDPYIKVSLDFSPNLQGDRAELLSLSVTDNGIGFNKQSYERLVVFKDDTKGFRNHGSGRLQMIHFFEKVIFNSIYQEGDTLEEREFTLSKSKEFLDKNTILRTKNPTQIKGREIQTTVKLSRLWDERKDGKEFVSCSLSELKEKLIQHYLLHFCSIRASLPHISIVYSIRGEERENIKIDTNDIPTPTREDISFEVPIYQYLAETNKIDSTENNVVINILPYRISSNILSSNEIRITSKGEVSETQKLKLTCVASDSSLGGNRYLFLLKSDYFDELEGDERGYIELLDKTEFKRRGKQDGYVEPQLLLNDIQEKVNDVAREVYQEISEHNEMFRERAEQLKKDYLLSEEALKELNFSDSTEDIFKKAYIYDAKILAKENANYENNVQNLKHLDPSSDDYGIRLAELVDNVVTSIPIHNRVELSKYVTRRNMVIELMGKILDRMLDCQDKAKRNEDEKLLHNLIFKQHSDNPLTSDLWLINEEYMYFKGSSERFLSKVELEGKKIFREEFEAEEERYLSSLGENRKNVRTDVLLFPSEGKCVIIEFKNPNVNIAEHLTQVSKYAYFLRNFTKTEYKFLTFYGYLIGESLEKRDVRAADGDFKTTPNLDYLFRPMKTVPDDSGTNQDGSLYMEVIQYSVLKERAELRNKAFIDCLLENSRTDKNKDLLQKQREFFD